MWRWARSTIAGYRRAAQAAVSVSTGLTAATDQTPAHAALWHENPASHASPVVHLYAPLVGFGTASAGASIAAAANAAYVEVHEGGTDA